MIRGLAHAKAVIDFGNDESLDEDEVDGAAGDGRIGVWGAVVPKMTSLRESMDMHLADASRGERFQMEKRRKSRWRTTLATAPWEVARSDNISISRERQ